MGNKNCDWLEEEVVDFVLGRLAYEKREHFSRHLNQCERCAAVYRDWTGVLSDQSEQRVPSPALKRRLRRSVSATNGAALFSRCLKPRVLVPTAGILTLFLLAAGSLSGNAPFSGPGVAVRQEILKEQAMMMDPRTVVHVVVPVVKADVRGYVWVNDNSNEMLFLADGLDRQEEKDYQVWFIMENGRSNVGVLKWSGGMAHLYFQGEEVRQVQNIAVSLEPKGGSFAPTGPETMYVKVKHTME